MQPTYVPLTCFDCLEALQAVKAENIWFIYTYYCYSILNPFLIRFTDNILSLMAYLAVSQLPAAFVTALLESWVTGQTFYGGRKTVRHTCKLFFIYVTSGEQIIYVTLVLRRMTLKIGPGAAI